MSHAQETLLQSILKELKETSAASVRDRFSRTFFSESIITEKRNQVNLSSAIPLSDLREIQETSNGATISQVNAHYLMSTNATANANASLTSVGKANYSPGSALMWGVGVRPTRLPQTTAVAKFGCWRNHPTKGVTGMYYRLDSDGVWVVIQDDPTNLFVEKHQDQWNINQLDGDSYGNFNILNGHMFRGKYGHYGYTPFVHEIGIEFVNEKFLEFDSLPVNLYKRNNGVSLTTPNLPIRVELDGGADGEDIDLEIGGRQIASFGQDKADFRTPKGIRLDQTLTAGVWFPMVHFKGKADYEEVQKFMTSITVISDNEGVWRIREAAPTDGTLATPPYGYVATEVATQFNVTATTTGTGPTIASGIYSGTNQTQASTIDEMFRPIKNNQDYTLELLSGANATATAEFAVREYW